MSAGEQWTTLLQVIEAHCHPDADSEAYADLQALARDPEDEEMRVFKDELRAALIDPGLLPEGRLFRVAQFEDGSDAQFLARLWRDLYPGEALPG